VIGEYYAGVNEQHTLTLDDVNNNTIAYGSDADVGVLTGIANASGGQEYAGTPQNIKQVYLDISQFF